MKRNILFIKQKQVGNKKYLELNHFIYKQKLINVVMKNYVLEIQNSEGGEDSKLLVEEMYDIYSKVMQKNHFAHTVISRRAGFVSI